MPKKITKLIYVFDSGSTDRTEQIVKENNILLKICLKNFHSPRK